MRVVAPKVLVVVMFALPLPVVAGSDFAAAPRAVPAAARIDFQITIPRVMSLQLGPTVTIPADANIHDPVGSPGAHAAAGNARGTAVATAIRLPTGLATTAVVSSGAAVAQVVGRSLPLSLTAHSPSLHDQHGRVTYTASAP